MPRKKWDQKNPYCRRSKLSKEAFEKLILFYFMEVTSGCSRSSCVQLLGAGQGGVKLSRQSMSKYFDRIGQYIWDNMILPTDPLYQDITVLDELLDFVYGKIDEVSEKHNIAYKYLDDLPVNAKDFDIPVQRTLMFHLLLKRSKALKGFPKNQFYLEFSRIFFICAVVEAKGMDMKSNDNFFEYLTVKGIDRLAYTVMIMILKQNPL